MSAAYDKWFNEEMDLKDPWEVTLEKAFEAGVKVGASADRFEPDEDDYDPKREELLLLARDLAVAGWPQWLTSWAGELSAEQTEKGRLKYGANTAAMAAAIIAEVDRVSGGKP